MKRGSWIRPLSRLVIGGGKIGDAFAVFVYLGSVMLELTSLWISGFDKGN